MRKYIVKRLVLTIPVLFGVTALTFFMMRVAPGDIISLMYLEDGNVTQAQIDAARAALGLDRPLIVQYFDWLWGLLRGDAGYSAWTGRPVVGEVMERLPVTIHLAGLAFVLQLIIGIPMGIYSATHQDRLGDQLSRLIVLMGVAMPNFWLGTLAIVFLATSVGWLPPIGSVTYIWQDPFVSLQIFMLPAIVLAIGQAAVIARYTRNTMLEVTRQDYIRTAFAKGLSARRVWNVHALRNAMIPVVTVIGAQLAALMTGTVVTESVFAIPGVGGLLLSSINSRDIPLLQFIVLFLALIYVGMNLLVDISYAWIDPRIRYS
ncbi:MAG: ABC transporter permease [Dehalococcoidia bacterium]